MWLIIAILGINVPTMGLSAKHLDDRASDAIKTSTTAMDTVAELKTNNAVLSTKIDILQKTLEEVRQDLKSRQQRIISNRRVDSRADRPPGPFPGGSLFYAMLI